MRGGGTGLRWYTFQENCASATKSSLSCVEFDCRPRKKKRSEKFDLSMDLARFPGKKKNFMGYGFRLYRDFQLNGHFISLEIPI